MYQFELMPNEVFADIAVTPDDVAAMYENPAWLVILQICLERRSNLLRAAASPELTDRQAALVAGKTEALMDLVNLPNIVMANNTMEETPVRLQSKQELKQKLKGIFDGYERDRERRGRGVGRPGVGAG